VKLWRWAGQPAEVDDGLGGLAELPPGEGLEALGEVRL
jgi:hypothetical protein